MNNQGFLGALAQYWTVEPKARLHRRNSWFDDHQPSSYDSLKVGIVASALATAIVMFWCILGVLL